MKFTETPIEGVFVIELEKHGDERGFFARMFCEKEFREHGLATHFVQVNDSLAEKKGTLRGLHYQLAPASETKLVRCIRGALQDVIIDLRPGSKTFCERFSVDLTAENRTMLYVPKGFAHGFITLTDQTEAFYLVDEFYSAELERGVRWDDPKFNIQWPVELTVISDKDAARPDFDPDRYLE